MPSWSRELNTTIRNYIRKREINVLRNRKFLALLQSKGRVTFDHSGTEMDWKVEYKQAPIQGFADGDTVTFAPRDRWKTAVLGWRGYMSTDVQTKMQRLKNKGTEAIIKVYAEIADLLMRDMEQHFGDELYRDGNAAGNEKFIHGLESWFGTSGANASAPIGTPSDTYAGLTTGLGDYGGAWSGAWPSGTGNAHYDFWSPVIVDYTSAVAASAGGWTNATKTWPNTCTEAMRFGLSGSRRNSTLNGMIDLVMLERDLYRQYENSLDSKERLVVRRGEKKGGLYALGFEDTINFDGADITWEYGVPTTVGYGTCINALELCSLQPQLFVPEGPFFDEASQCYRFFIDYYGNLKNASPRDHFKLDNVS